MISAAPSPELAAVIAANESVRRAAAPKHHVALTVEPDYGDLLWQGSRPPASAGDTWLSAGAAAYNDDLGDDHPGQAIEVRRAEFRAALAGEASESNRFPLEESRGALLLDALRQKLGDDRFFALMNRFFPAHAIEPINADAFIAAAGPDARPVFNEWLSSGTIPRVPEGPRYLLSAIHPGGGAISNAVIVYGTVTEAGANRYAAEQLQKRLLEWFETPVSIQRDFELSGQELHDRNVIFVGRPETNSALAAVAKSIGLVYDGGDFTIRGVHHASEREALALAAANPDNPKRMVLLVAGNSALETVRLAREMDRPRAQFAIYDDGDRTSAGFLP